MHETLLIDLVARAAGPMTPSLRIEEAADLLASTNPSFDREKFIRRATKAHNETFGVSALTDTLPY
jgi:hypothetical protein